MTNIELKRIVQGYIFRLLAARDYSTGRIRQKCLDRGYDANIVEDVINDCVSSKLLNDTRFAENIIDIYKGKKGDIWIKNKLKSLGIAQDNYMNILDNESFVSTTLINNIIKKYKLSKDNYSRELEFKYLGYIARQGFTNRYEIIAAVKNELGI
jgi:SOS response regulatory protein OraA/RecX